MYARVRSRFGCYLERGCRLRGGVTCTLLHSPPLRSPAWRSPSPYCASVVFDRIRLHRIELRLRWVSTLAPGVAWKNSAQAKQHHVKATHPTVERPALPRHGATVAMKAQGRHPPSRARCRVWITQDGPASNARQSPRAKIEQGSANRSELARNTLPSGSAPPWAIWQYCQKCPIPARTHAVVRDREASRAGSSDATALQRCYQQRHALITTVMCRLLARVVFGSPRTPSGGCVPGLPPRAAVWHREG